MIKRILSIAFPLLVFACSAEPSETLNVTDPIDASKIKAELVNDQLQNP